MKGLKKWQKVTIGVIVVLVLLTIIGSCGSGETTTSSTETEPSVEETITIEESIVEPTETEVGSEEETETIEEETTTEETTVEETSEVEITSEESSEIDMVTKINYLLSIKGSDVVGVEEWDEESISNVFDIMYPYIEACGGIDNIDIEETRLYLYDSEYGFYSESEAVDFTDFEVIRAAATLEEDYWVMWENGEFEEESSTTEITPTVVTADNFDTWYRSAELGDYVSISGMSVTVVHAQDNMIMAQLIGQKQFSVKNLYVVLDDASKIRTGDVLNIVGYYTGNNSSNNNPCFKAETWSWQ